MPVGCAITGWRRSSATSTSSASWRRRAYEQNACFDAALQFARTEGLIPAPESSHAIRAAIDEALDAREAGEERVILFNLSGHGHFDMAAYDDYLSGKLS